MKPKLESITITDFRSVRGTVTVPLNASIVLVHGPNGSGKTSLFSAIELALTGEATALRRADPQYVKHLTNRDAEFARIMLRAGGLESTEPTIIEVRDSTITGTPLLPSKQARDFSERCYLAQSTLGRLLEIYQYTDPRQSDSALTRYVKDLLGLDQLDSLVEGLHDVGDVRRLRRLVPEYRETEEELKRLSDSIISSRGRLVTLSAKAEDLRQSLIGEVARLFTAQTPTVSLESLNEIKQLLVKEVEDPQLIDLAKRQRELAALRSEWEILSIDTRAAERQALEEQDQAVSAAASEWRASSGKELDALIASLREKFADLPSSAMTDPEFARSTALSAVDLELARCSRQLEQDDADLARLASLEQENLRKLARRTAVDQQLSQLTDDAHGLNGALAQLLPYLQGNECPVCGRDFSEVSSESLMARVAALVSQLTERAARLESLSKERSLVDATMTAATREREQIVQRQMSQDSRANLKARIAQLSEAAVKLRNLAAGTAAGANFLRRASEASKLLSNLRSRDQRATALREDVSQLAISVDQVPLLESEGISDAIVRLDSWLHTQESALIETQQLRRSAREQLENLKATASQLDDARKILRRDELRCDLVAAALAKTDERRNVAKGLADAALRARTTIVRRIFNQSLNAIWRELFIRLAPDEPFVPAFALPQDLGGPVVAMLETVHRQGNRGGSPGAMLSSGNLNTAALTLFFALHLAAELSLPWLVLDDPVQSMDEVHISQFAALLRTLSKAQGRQILIAVHEKPLFDYLSLELSPSFQDDQLITVQLGRASNGNTLAEPNFYTWERDKAVA